MFKCRSRDRRIGNPVRIRDGTATVMQRAYAIHHCFYEKVHMSVEAKSGDLLK